MKLIFKSSFSTSIFLLLFKILISLLPFAIIILTGIAIDVLIKEKTISNIEPFYGFLIIIAIVCFTYILDLINNYFYYSLSNKMQILFAKNIANNLVKQYKESTFKGIKSYNSSEFFTNVFQNSNNYFTSIFDNFSNIISSSLILTISLITLAIDSWMALVILLVALILVLIPNIISFKKTEQYQLELQEKFAKLLEKTDNLLNGYSRLYYANKEHLLEKFLATYIYDFHKTNYLKNRLETVNSFFSSGILKAIEYGGTLVLGILILKGDYGISLSSLFIFRNILNEKFSNELTLVFSSFRVYLASKKLVNAFDLKLEKETKESIDLEFNTIEIKNLNYKTSEKIIFNNFNYKFEKGKKYLIIGHSGSGKSTLLKLILNELENYEGTIEIDQLNIKNIDYKQLKSNLCYLDSQNFVFDDNIKNNLSLWENDETKIDKILKFIEFDKELEKEIIDYNFDSYNQLSLGQKQRLAFARLLFYEKDFLLLDESFSNLNKKLSNNLLNKLIDSDKTIIYVSHHIDEQEQQLFDYVINLDKLNK
ncbi:ABC transporter ATP-binding protein [Mesomycoplasma lagogenitalium]|uniref:ABC transporter ATP-binding protein n=1 Tax=Mesomycoplasma lagogenitalium TaxID=171286 RepID=A0ABY8LUE6_9BACT|nr:ABC transporter ATP-binding protein [Mesomycoplasma lagogenitalium]WGI36854.1 ABC transporter ATP-binding protein [Mesomycoplasma lagogenitalium]